MLIQIILALLLGLIAGTLTGLIPGIHINLVAATILILITSTQFSTIELLVFITAMAITHTFVDFIPSIFLGAPDEDTGLGVLPGHELLLKGQGHQAIKLTTLGSTLAITLLIFIIPIFLFTIPKIYPFIERMLGIFLIWIVILLIFQEKEGKIKAIIIFTLAGFLGIASMNLNIQQPLLPLLTGLFGASTIINSIKSKTKVPPQKIEKLQITKKELIKPTIATILASPICSFFPGLGSSQAAVIGSKITGKLNTKQFLILLGSVNTLVISISFVTLFLIQKSRTGAAATISQITPIDQNLFLIILTTIFITTIFAIPLTIQLSKLFAKNIHKIPYTKISSIILIFLTIIILTFSNFNGLLVFITATILGLTCIEFQTRRSFLMGAILIPTIIFYLPF
ncbi:tripartite tricarboxylate transporter permease [Candidatus Pacearchaeota archaeon]|nr:tripartite tricarboxylate transporter permease [Candidatus Pacearchaeota archaeon]